MEIATVTSTAEIDYAHPNLAYARFIFADDKPNGNNEGIEYEDFPALIKSAIDMPIKMRLATNSAGGHKGSIRIGHIKSVVEKPLDDGTHQLVAEAVLYAKDFPEEIQFLKEAYASGEAPGISWELDYVKKVIKNGVAWLKGAVATAATFVKFPAYGARTALLALASLTTITDEEMSRELTALASEFNPTITDKGGNTMEMKELEEKIEALTKQVTEADAAKVAAEAKLISAQAEVTSKDEVIAKYQKNALIEDRTKAVTEAGIKMDVDDAKKEFLAALSEDVFAQYLADLTAASKTAPKQQASASLRGTEVPKLGITASEGPVDISSLRERMRGYGRDSVTATE